MRTTIPRSRRMVVPVLTAVALVLPASSVLAAQVFHQFDALTTHIYSIEGQPQSIRRPAHVAIRVTALSRELTGDEERSVTSQVPDPLNDLCSTDVRDDPNSKVDDCTVAEMEAALEQRIVASFEQIPSLSFDDVSVHVSMRRDGVAKQQALLLSPVLLVPVVWRRRLRAGRTD